MFVITNTLLIKITGRVIKKESKEFTMFGIDLQYKIFGILVRDWAFLLFILLGVFVSSKIFYTFSNKIIKKFFIKVDSKFAYILIDMIEEPLIVIFSILSVWYSFYQMEVTVEFLGNLKKVLTFLIVVDIAWGISRLFNAITNEYVVKFVENTETTLDDVLLPVVRRFILFIIWSIAILFILQENGFNVSAVVGSFGIGGIAFALAARQTFTDIIAGFLLFMDQHITIGDRIQLTGNESRRLIDGNVVHMGVRCVYLKSRYEGRIISIPNSVVANQDVVNVENEKGRQMFAVYKLHPNTAPEKIKLAMKILKTIVKANENTTEVVVTGFIGVSEISRDITLLYWIVPEASNLKTRTAINLEIITQFEENKIEFTVKTDYRYQQDVIY